MSMISILVEIESARKRQDEKWGGPAHDDFHSHDEWSDILRKRLGEVRLALTNHDDDAFRQHMVEVLATETAWLESFDRLKEGPYTPPPISVSAPYNRGSDTSKIAAEMATPALRQGNIRKVYDHFLAYGMEGSWCKRGEKEIPMTHESCSGAINRCWKEGALLKTPRRAVTPAGRPCMFYVAVPGFDIEGMIKKGGSRAGKRANH